jgi:hypothetical protein
MALERDEIALRGFKVRRKLKRVGLDGPPDQVADEPAGVVSVLLDGSPRSSRHAVQDF